ISQKCKCAGEEKISHYLGPLKTSWTQPKSKGTRLILHWWSPGIISFTMSIVAPLRFRPAQARLSLMESSCTSNGLSQKHVRHPRGALINNILQDQIQVNHT